MKPILIVLFALVLPALSQAAVTQLVDEKEIEKWGYHTLHNENTTDDDVTIIRQVIKSIKQVKGKKNHYHYYSLTQECYTGRLAAIKRRSGLIFLKEKDYRRAELSGKCVRIVDTGAYFDTFGEQPRIFRLFNQYLDKQAQEK